MNEQQATLIFNKLREIQQNAGDTMGRDGEYLSTQIGQMLIYIQDCIDINENLE